PRPDGGEHTHGSTPRGPDDRGFQGEPRRARGRRLGHHAARPEQLPPRFRLRPRWEDVRDALRRLRLPGGRAGSRVPRALICRYSRLQPSPVAASGHLPAPSAIHLRPPGPLALSPAFRRRSLPRGARGFPLARDGSTAREDVMRGARRAVSLLSIGLFLLPG